MFYFPICVPANHKIIDSVTVRAREEQYCHIHPLRHLSLPYFSETYFEIIQDQTPYDTQTRYLLYMSPTHYCSATCSNHCSISYLWASVFCLLNEDHGGRNECTLADKVNWVIGHWIQQCNCFLQQNQMNM